VRKKEVRRKGRVIRAIKARRKIKAIRKTLLNILLLTIDRNSILC